MDNFATIGLPALDVSTREAEARADTSLPSREHADEVLIACLCGGNNEALALLFCRYSRIVRGVAYRVLRDPSEADDLLQDVFLLVHRLCGTFDPSKGSAKSWILQMTYRRALCRRRYLTTRHFYKRLDLDEVADELADSQESERFENTLDGTFGAGRAEQIFASLAENQRQTLQLYFIEGYTLNEIAQKLGQSLGNVKHYYFRGLEKLRKELIGSKVHPKRAVS